MKAGRSLAIAAGAAMLVLSGTLVAYADWTVASEPTVVTLRSADMPQGNAPSVEKTGKNATLRWVPNRIVPGVKVQSYIVTRVGQGDPVVVCDQVTTASCRDKLVPAGTWTWKVRPVLETWQGEDSPPSLPLQFTGSPRPPAAAKGTGPAADSIGVPPDPATEPDTVIEQSADAPPAPTTAATPSTADEPTTAPQAPAPATPAVDPTGNSSETARP
jgi:hypothetical protein